MTALKTELTVPVSPEQEEVIARHLLLGAELGMVPDERVWMLGHARRKHPNCRIMSADLDVACGEWTLVLELGE